MDAIVADPNGVPTVEEIRKLERTRLCLAEGMRMYPAPPILIRRALEDVTLPAGGMGREITLKKGTDCFIAVWNLHRSPDLWDEPDKFDPMRFKRPFVNESIEGWGGLQPELFTGLYPNENATGEFLFVLESVRAIVLRRLVLFTSYRFRVRSLRGRSTAVRG